MKLHDKSKPITLSKNVLSANVDPPVAQPTSMAVEICGEEEDEEEEDDTFVFR